MLLNNSILIRYKGETDLTLLKILFFDVLIHKSNNDTIFSKSIMILVIIKNKITWRTKIFVINSC